MGEQGEREDGPTTLDAAANAAPDARRPSPAPLGGHGESRLDVPYLPDRAQSDSAPSPTTTAVDMADKVDGEGHAPTPASEAGPAAPPAPPFTDVERTQTAASSKPYSAFPTSTRWLIALLGGVGGIFSPISVSVGAMY